METVKVNLKVSKNFFSFFLLSVYLLNCTYSTDTRTTLSISVEKEVNGLWKKSEKEQNGLCYQLIFLIQTMTQTIFIEYLLLLHIPFMNC